MKRVFALGHLKRVLNTLNTKELTKLDVKLLKGYYIKSSKEGTNEATEGQNIFTGYTRRNSTFNMLRRIVTGNQETIQSDFTETT